MKKIFLVSKVFVLMTLMSCSSDNSHDEQVVIDVPTVPETPITPPVSNPNTPTGCGNQSTVTDIEGNVYKIVQIGNKCWMQSNLRTRKFKNGEVISTNLAKDNPNSAISDSVAGKYYNRGMEQYESNKLCPEGWHLADGNDWRELESTLGPDNATITLALKQPEYWNNQGNNSSGFSAFKGGFINRINQHIIGDGYAYFWNSSASNGAKILSYNRYYSEGLNGVYFISCRCVRDN